MGETEYKQTFDTLIDEFGKLCATAKSRYDELLHDKNELNVGFKDPATFERRLSELGEEIYAAKLGIKLKIMPLFRIRANEFLKKNGDLSSLPSIRIQQKMRIAADKDCKVEGF